MNVFEKMSGHLAGHLGEKLGLDTPNREVLAYGAYSLLYAAWSILLLAAIGFLMGTLAEILIISSAASLLRRYSGGAHASSPHRCAMTGVVIFGALALGVKSAKILGTGWIYLYLAAAYGISRMWVSRHAPVDSATKPIREEERRRRFKKESQRVVDVLFLGIFIGAFLTRGNIATMWTVVMMSVSTGLLWQAFTLTDYGSRMIAFFDKAFMMGKEGLR